MHHPPHFPPLPRLSPHHKKRADVKQRFNAPKGFISSNTPPTPFFFRQYPNFPPFSHLHISAPYFPFPFSSYHARSLLFPPISSFPAIFSFAHFRPLLPVSLFIIPRPSLLFPPISPLSLFFLPTLPNLPSLLQFFLLYPFLSHPRNKKNPHPRKKNLIIKKKCCN